MNWTDRITRARQAGRFSQVDVNVAEDWVTCACGEQDKRIPRLSEGEPKDEELYDLGKEFYRRVVCDDITGAALTLVGIEARAKQVLTGGGAC